MKQTGQQQLTPRELFDEIERVILEEPKRIRMGDYVYHPINLRPEETPACGTVACIAGWAVALGSDLRGEELRHKFTERAAEVLLCLDGSQAVSLFYHYPPQRPGTRAYAEAVVAHMERFRNGVPHLARPA